MAKEGRPTKYREEFIDKVDEYILNCKDTLGKKSINVNLPMIEGFARYIDVSKRSIYEWKDKYPEFSHALEKIEIEQKKRLIEMGLANVYNSAIAKLVLSANHGMKERSDMTSDDKPIIGNEITIKKFK